MTTTETITQAAKVPKVDAIINPLHPSVDSSACTEHAKITTTKQTGHMLTSSEEHFQNMTAEQRQRAHDIIHFFR